MDFGCCLASMSEMETESVSKGLRGQWSSRFLSSLSQPQLKEKMPQQLLANIRSATLTRFTKSRRSTVGLFV